MSDARKIEIAFDEQLPIRLKLIDGIVYDRVMVEEFDGNEFIVSADDELIRKCHAAGRYRICALYFDDVAEAEILAS